MAQLFRNNAFSSLGATLTNVATTLTVASGHGDRFPVVAAPDFMMVTLQDASNNIEIIKVTARTAASDSMTIQRAQEGTAARSWSIGDVVELRITASALNPLGLLEGAATAAAIRAALVVPTRTGGDASGTWGINISGNAATATTAADCSGNAATVTNGVYTTGDQTVGGIKTFSSPPIFNENVQVISTNTTAVKSRTYVLTASLTLTLPASPAAGDWVKVVNRSGTTTPVIARNGSNIMGLAEDMTLDSANAPVTLVYADATRGWVIS